MTTPEVGTILRDRYVLRAQLGRNTTRQTWLAEDRAERKAVVVKMLAFNLQLQWQEVKLFEREAQALQKLDHPRIPKYLDYFTVEGQPSWMTLVQSYVLGQSLQTLLDKGTEFDEGRLKHIARDVLIVLSYLHARKPPVLHRDIKPSNLIVGEGGLTYVVDFGAAQIQPAQLGTFTVVGTYGYTPMEQFGGRAVPASDLYALGATLVHLATGIPPADLPLNGSKMDFRNRAQLSSHFSDWLETLIEPLVGDRFDSVEDASATLQDSEESNKAPQVLQQLSQARTVTTQYPKTIGLSLNSSCQDSEGKSWHLLCHTLPESSIRYQKSDSGIEIRFKTHRFESYMPKGEISNNHWQRSKILGNVSTLFWIFLLFTGVLLPASNQFLFLLIALLSGFLSILSKSFSYSFEYLPNATELALLVKDGYFAIWKVQGTTRELLFSGTLNKLQIVGFYGIGMKQMSIKIASTNVEPQYVKIDASLNGSELNWLQETINQEIQRLVTVRVDSLGAARFN